MSGVKITQERLKQLVTYSPETGTFTWNVGSANNQVRAGDAAGGLSTQGYRAIRLDGTLYLSQSLAWLHEKGEWPVSRLFHLDGNKLNNKIDNLVGHRVNIPRKAPGFQADILTHPRLRHLLDYNAATGAFTWKVSTSRRISVGDEAGSLNGRGIRYVAVDGKRYQASHLAWFWVYGSWSLRDLTHLNGDLSDNRLENISPLTGQGSVTPPIGIDRLRAVLDFDPLTGIFRWKASDRGRRITGEEAGAEMSIGYRIIGLDGQKYLAHRLAWYYVYNEWPPHQVDHINGVRDDNRIVNLRLATNAQNGKNTGLRSTNTSGYKGVSFSKRRGLWIAKIVENYKSHVLGYFRTAEQAAEAYALAANRLHGEFANTGRVEVSGDKTPVIWE